ncbi:glycosyltransferase family 2 protein [Algoriphagus sp.]|uniref:glycosyltransferase family 2 protein n=1 Tax=Algoriphagus sp. TaxID=1872435 RepID=UPI00263481E0|nr:glycosyltransferase family 2 protein [Algoriphagus sp.]
MNKILNPLVSILIPVFNRENLVGETISSIQNQTYTNWECVLVDDGSTDDSLKVLQDIAFHDSRVKIFSRPKDRSKGAAACRNVAFEHSHGEYIQYFDSDDLMLPTMLEEKVKLLNSNHKLDFVVSKMGRFDENGPLDLIDYPLKSSNLIEDFLTYQVFFLTPGPLFKKRFLEKFEIKFDELLHRRQEREFYTRVILENPSYLTSDQVHCLRRIHSESIKFKYDREKPSSKVWAKFMFYRSLYKNSKGNIAGLMQDYFGREISRMSLFFLRVGQVLKAIEVLRFRVELGKKANQKVE